MVALIVFSVLAVVTIGLLLAGEKPGAALAGIATAVALVGSCLTHVGSNEVGVVHNFGSFQSTEGPGVHWVAPWSQTESFTTRLQSHKVKDHDVVLKPEREGASGAPASVWYTIRYHVNGTERAEYMWRKYRSFERVTNDLVVPESKTTANEVLGQYTPATSQAGSNRRIIGTKIKVALGKVLEDDGIKVDSVSVTTVALPKEVRDRLSGVQKAAADAQRAAVEAQARLDTATKDKETAAQQAAADKLRKGQATRETLLDKCLGNQRFAIEENAKAGKTITPVPSCEQFYKQNDLVPAR